MRAMHICLASSMCGNEQGGMPAFSPTYFSCNCSSCVYIRWKHTRKSHGIYKPHLKDSCGCCEQAQQELRMKIARIRGLC